MVLIPAFSLQLIWTSCRRGYIIILRPPTSCERHNSHSIQPVDSQGYPPISSTGCTRYLHRCISHLTARPGRRSICNSTSVGRSSRIYIYQHCADTGCSLEDLPEAMNDRYDKRERERERERESVDKICPNWRNIIWKKNYKKMKPFVTWSILDDQLNCSFDSKKNVIYLIRI